MYGPTLLCHFHILFVYFWTALLTFMNHWGEKWYKGDMLQPCLHPFWFFQYKRRWQAVAIWYDTAFVSKNVCMSPTPNYLHVIHGYLFMFNIGCSCLGDPLICKTKTLNCLALCRKVTNSQTEVLVMSNAVHLIFQQLSRHFREFEDFHVCSFFLHPVPSLPSP